MKENPKPKKKKTKVAAKPKMDRATAAFVKAVQSAEAKYLRRLVPYPFIDGQGLTVAGHRIVAVPKGEANGR